MRFARIVVKDSEVDLDVFEVKKTKLKRDSKHKTPIHFESKFDNIVNAVHNYQGFLNSVHL